MKAPDIFANFWADDSEKISFQEVLSWNVQAESLQLIKNELQAQLVSEKITERIPNIDWANPRSFEKWEQFASNMLLHVALPENVWKKWIQLLEPQYQADTLAQEVPAIDYSFLENPFPAFEQPLQTEEDLLTAEVYFVSEESEKSEESEESEESAESEESGERVELKVFEALQVNDAPLLKKVESQLVEKLSSSISLYQSIHFTKELFEGNTQKFQQFIQFVDEKATPGHWRAELEQQFPSLFQLDDNKAWAELYKLIEKKFN